MSASLARSGGCCWGPAAGRAGHWHQAYRFHRQQMTPEMPAISSATERTPMRRPSKAKAPNSALEDSATCLILALLRP